MILIRKLLRIMEHNSDFYIYLDRLCDKLRITRSNNRTTVNRNQKD